MAIYRPTSITALIHASAAQKKPDRFKELYQQLLRTGFQDVTEEYPALSLTRDNKPISVYVDWGCAVVAPLSTLIATDGLNGCAALKIIDKTANLQYLIHVLRDETITSFIELSLIKANALGINFNESEIEIMPGLKTSTNAVPRILEALHRINPSLLDKTSLIRNLEQSDIKQGLIMHNGRTYRYSDSAISFDYKYYRLSSNKPTIEANGFIRVL